MNDNSKNEAKPAKAAPVPTSTDKKGVFAVFAVAVIAVAAVGYYVSNTGIDQKIVDLGLKNFQKTIAQNPSIAELNPKFTYDAVTIEGSFTKRFALVKNPRITVTKSGKETEFSTPSLELYVKELDLSAAQLLFINDITVKEAGATVATISFPEKPIYTYEAVTKDGKPAIKYSAELQNGMNIKGEDGKSIAITYDADPKLSGVVDREGKSGDTTIAFSNFVVKDPDAGEVYKTAVLKFDTKSTPSEGGVNLMTAQAEISNLLPTGMDTVYGTLGLKADLDVKGSLDGVSSAENAVKVRTLALTGKDFQANVTADLTSSATDPLPAGVANLSIQNFEYVYNNLVKVNLPPEMLTIVDAIIEKASGTPVASLKDLSIDFKREKGGTSYIGKATFEEVAGLVMPLFMQQMMLGAPATPTGEPTSDPAATTEEAPSDLAPAAGEGTPAEATPSEAAPEAPKPAN